MKNICGKQEVSEILRKLFCFVQHREQQSQNRFPQIFEEQKAADRKL